MTGEKGVSAGIPQHQGKSEIEIFFRYGGGREGAGSGYE